VIVHFVDIGRELLTVMIKLPYHNQKRFFLETLIHLIEVKVIKYVHRVL